MSEQVTHPGLKSSNGSLAAQYGLGLLDLDGVVYRGKNPVEHAAEGITAAASAGMSISYTTNNSSRNQETVAAQIASFGLEVSPAQIITSAIAAARMLAHHLPQGSRVLCVGADHLREEVTKLGFTVVGDVSERPQAVIQGWWPGVTWRELAQAAYSVEAGARYFVTNRDLTIPREFGIAPGSGSLIQAVVTATGVEPVASAGKPEAAMYDEMRSMFADEGYELVPVERSLPVGDRLDTDIEAANRGGYDSLVVLTGVADARQLMRAVPVQRPTYISQDLRGLIEEHTAPEHVGQNRYRLGNMTAQYSQGVLSVASLKPEEWAGAYDTENLAADVTDHDMADRDVIDHDAEARDVTDPAEASPVRVSRSAGAAALHSLDALRAACALAWDLADRGVDLSKVILPDFDFSSER